MAVLLWVALLLVLAGIGYQAVGTRRDAVRHPPPGRLVPVEGISGGRRLHLQCRSGEGPTVILEAGLAASSLSWARVQPEVARFAGVCAYDRAGLGWSDPAWGPVQARTLADDLHRLLSAAAIRPPYVLVGHSFGSFVVRAFADAHRNEVVGMVLVDPASSSEWRRPTGAAARRLSRGRRLTRLGTWLAAVGVVRACLTLLQAGSTAVPQRVSRLLGSDAAGTLIRLVGEVQKIPRELWPSVRAHWSRSRALRSLESHLAGLPASADDAARADPVGDLPLVVLTAASSSATTREEHARLAAQSSRGRHVVATQGGHWLHLDEPGIVVEATRDVVAAARADRRAGS